MEPLLGKTLSELQDVALAVGLKRFAGKQLAEWLYVRRATSFDEMTNISLAGRKALAEQYVIGRHEPVAKAESADGTKKYLFTADTPKGRQFIECVYIPSNSSPETGWKSQSAFGSEKGRLAGSQADRDSARSAGGVDNPQNPSVPLAPLNSLNSLNPLNSSNSSNCPSGRFTLCVSTQAGCRMGCKFCMTGAQGFHGHLTAADILNQIFSVPESALLTNLVYMGEGEPMDNIGPVMRSLEIMTADYGCAWSPHRITVSTVGAGEGLDRFLKQSECDLAISLHNPFPSERAEIMPAERLRNIKQVLNWVGQQDFRHQRRLSFEYIVWAGKNDTMRHAQELRRLVAPFSPHCRVNLIRFHADPGASPQRNGESGIRLEGNNQQDTLLFPATDEQKMQWLCDYLNDNGVTTTIRRSRGEDILAACGMLAGNPDLAQSLQ